MDRAGAGYLRDPVGHPDVIIVSLLQVVPCQLV